MEFRKTSYVSLLLIAVASIATSILCVMNIDGDARLFKTKLSISFKNNNFEYNGSTIDKDQINYEFLEGDLAFNDRIDITLNGEIKKAGSYNKKHISYRILNGSGNDVTSSYDISEKFEDIVINKRKIYFRSIDAAFTYDGITHIFEDAYVSDGSLAYKEEFSCFNFKSFCFDGTYENKFDVEIKNYETGEVTTNNYDINREYGVIIVAPKGE